MKNRKIENFEKKLKITEQMKKKNGKLEKR